MKNAQSQVKQQIATQSPPARPVPTPVIQPKLAINPPGDRFEQEADHVAEAVVRMREGDVPVLQRMALSPVGGVQRKCPVCGQEECEGCVQRKDAGGIAPEVPQSVSAVLGGGGGHALEAGARQFMESRFGRDFSQVRVHTDGRAAQSAADIGARAYTSGQNVVFGSGEYRPSEAVGRRLLAHELAHVGQQEGAGTAAVQRTPLEPNYDTWPEMIAQGRTLAARFSPVFRLYVLRGRRLYIFDPNSFLGQANLRQEVNGMERGVFGYSGRNMYRFEADGTQRRVTGVAFGLEREAGMESATAPTRLTDLLEGAPPEMEGEVPLQVFISGPHIGPAISSAEESPGTESEATHEAPDAPSAMERVAVSIHEALSFNDERARVVNLMIHRNAGERALLQHYFLERFGMSLESFLVLEMRDLLGASDELVKALPLLEAEDWNRPEQIHVRLGLALLGPLTRDTNLFGILESEAFAARRAHITQDYERTYHRISRGSLRGDVEAKFFLGGGEKALLLLERDLTDADHIYFDTLGRTGTNTPEVTERLQRIWDQGFPAFEQLEIQWNAINPIWRDNLSLRVAIESELSGERWAWDIIRPMFTAYEEWQENRIKSDSAFSEDTLRLRVATETLAAAAEGGYYFELGSDEEQIFRAVGQISTIYQSRIAAASSDAERENLRAEWRRERERIMGIIRGEFEEGYTNEDFIRARMLLYRSGRLTDADEILLADFQRDYGRVGEIVARVWQQGSDHVEALRADAARPLYHQEAGDAEAVWLRNAVSLPPASTLLHDPENTRRIEILLDPDRSHAANGAVWIHRELREHRDEAGLRAVHRLLSENGIAPGLRHEVMREYVGRYLRFEDESSGRSPEAVFVSGFMNQFAPGERTDAWFDLLDLLQPANSLEESTNRATLHEQAEHSGFFDPMLTLFSSGYDAVTGEDTSEIVQERLSSLRESARLAEASPGQLEGTLALLGLRDPSELAHLQYEEFNQALDTSREARQAVAAVTAGIVELTVDLALTGLTGGAAGGVLLASLGSAVAGMLAHEALLGNQYELISRENAVALTTAIAAQGFNHLGAGLTEDLLNSETIQRLSRSQRFLAEASREGFAQGLTQVTETALSGRMPTTEEILGRAIAIAGQSAGAGLDADIAARLRENPDRVEVFRNQVARSFAQSIIGGLGEETGAMVIEGQALNGGEIASRLGRRFATDSLRGISSGMVQFYGEERTRRQVPGEGSPEIETPERDRPVLPGEEIGAIFDRNEHRDAYEEARDLDMVAHAESPDHLHHVEIYLDGIGRCSPADPGRACPLLRFVFRSLLQNMPRTRRRIIELEHSVGRLGVYESDAEARHLATIEQRLRDLEEHARSHPEDLDWDALDEGFFERLRTPADGPETSETVLDADHELSVADEAAMRSEEADLPIDDATLAAEEAALLADPYRRYPVREHGLLAVSMGDPEVRSIFREELHRWLSADDHNAWYVELVIRRYENLGTLQIGPSPRNTDRETIATTYPMRAAFIAAIQNGTAVTEAVTVFETYLAEVTSRNGSEDAAVQAGDAVWINSQTGDNLGSQSQSALATLWPAQHGTVWWVDHIVELQHGGSDDASNYCPVNNDLFHRSKGRALNEFGRRLRELRSDEIED